MIVETILSMLLPYIYVILGIIFWIKPPKKMNSICGYRTPRAMQTQETWDFANKYSGMLLLVIGFVLTMVTTIIDVLLYHWFKANYNVGVLLLFCTQALALIFPIIKTEKKLKATFDEKGMKRS
jgi:uncharacterized membrane protein